jgi:translation initiation factor 2-alpha kinase 4
MYSLGVIFFELWHPFATAMERHLVLSDLKQKGDLPKSWAAQFPGQLNLLRRLLSPSPSDRPSAVEVLQSELPPRMEDEWLNGKPLTFVHYRYIITT